jgi:DNA-binding CsgD family transcriptional regulator
MSAPQWARAALVMVRFGGTRHIPRSRVFGKRPTQVTDNSTCRPSTSSADAGVVRYWGQISDTSGAMQTKAKKPAASKLDLVDLGRDRGLALRPEIASSWRRSTSSGLAPDQFIVPAREPELESRFVQAARPVLGRLSADLADLDVSVILTDASANVLVRADGSRSIGAQLDRVSLGPGFAYAEDTVGTNAIGTALAMGAPALVMGREHFADVLTRLSCAAAPIVDPVSGDVVGLLDLTSSADDANPLMLGLARSGAREIEQRIGSSMPLLYRTVSSVWNGWQLLTPSEREVADLVSTGLTNKQIGARLYCSPYTVDSHLRSIYRKLGVNSRAALASHMSRVNEGDQAGTGSSGQAHGGPLRA